VDCLNARPAGPTRRRASWYDQGSLDGTAAAGDMIRSEYPLFPLARGGRGSVEFRAPGALVEWDGLTGFFVEFIDSEKAPVDDAYLRRWYGAALRERAAG